MAPTLADEWERTANTWERMYYDEIKSHNTTQAQLEIFMSSLAEANVDNLRLRTDLHRAQMKLQAVTEGLVGARESADAALNELINIALEEGEPLAAIEGTDTGDGGTKAELRQEG
jgi:hypothetical protein